MVSNLSLAFIIIKQTFFPHCLSFLTMALIPPIVFLFPFFCKKASKKDYLYLCQKQLTDFLYPHFSLHYSSCFSISLHFFLYFKHIYWIFPSDFKQSSIFLKLSSFPLPQIGLCHIFSQLLNEKSTFSVQTFSHIIIHSLTLLISNML